MRFYETILRFPKSVIALIVLITLFFGWHARKVELNNSLEQLLPQSHPAVIQDRELKHVFNSREMILIGVVHENGIFNPATLAKVKELTDNAWQITVARPEDARLLAAWAETVDAAYREKIGDILSGGLTVADRAAVNNLLIAAANDGAADPAFVTFLRELRLKLSPLSDVLSIAAVDNITSSEMGLDVTPPMEAVPRTDAELAALAETMFDNEMFVDLIVSADSTATLLLAELAFYYDDHTDLAHRVFEELEALAAPYEGPERIYLAGVPMVNVYTTTSMSGDMAKLTPLVILLVMAVMYLTFRMVRGVFIPLSVVLAAVVWTVGVMGLLGRPITMIVSMMPVMLIAIGIADGIHLITEYKLLWAELRDRDRAILGTMRQLAAPVILTSLTTMAGFGALATSNLRSIRDFGIFTSIGVFAAMVFSLTFVPAALKLMAPPGREAEGMAHDRLGRWLGRAAGLVVRRRRWVYAGVVALVAVSVAAITQITVGSTMVAMFKDDSAIVEASEMINQKFGGIEVMNIVVDTRIDDGLKDPVVLAKIAALQDTLETLPLVGYTSSLADYVKRTNLVMHGNDRAFNRIPRITEVVEEVTWAEADGREREVTRAVEISGRDLIAQYVLLYENAGGNDLEKLADFDYSKANVVVMIRDDFTPNLKTVMERARAFARENFGGDVEVTFAGCSTLCVVGDDLIIPGQLRSLGIAFVVVLLLLAVIFRSAGYGVMGLLPMVLTVLLVFMLLGALGVYLDAATALVASIVLGIGVDYSVHFLSRYRSLRAAGLAFPEAVRGTMVTSGRAIVFNSLAVAIGFLVLLLSSFWPVIHIGWLVSANMVFSAVVTMGLLPGVLSSWGGQVEAAGAEAGVRAVEDMASVPA